MLLSRGAKRLLSIISKFIARYGNGQFYACQDWIRKEGGKPVTIRTVQRWTAELVKAGKITIRRRSQDTNVYSLVAAKMSGQMSPQMSGQMSPRYKEDLRDSNTTYTPGRAMRKPPVREMRPIDRLIARYEANGE